MSIESGVFDWYYKINYIGNGSEGNQKNNPRQALSSINLQQQGNAHLLHRGHHQNDSIRKAIQNHENMHLLLWISPSHQVQTHLRQTIPQLQLCHLKR